MTNTQYINPYILTLKQIFIYLGAVIRKSLYTPFAIFLLVYLMLIYIVFIDLINPVFFADNEKLFNSILSFLIKLRILPSEETFNAWSDFSDFSGFLVSRMIIFGILLDLFSKLIHKFNKDWDRIKIHLLLLKYIFLFYVLSGLILISYLTIKTPNDFWDFFIVIIVFILANLVTFSAPWTFDLIYYSIMDKNSQTKVIIAAPINKYQKIINTFLIMFVVLGMWIILSIFMNFIKGN